MTKSFEKRVAIRDQMHPIMLSIKIGDLILCFRVDRTSLNHNKELMETNARSSSVGNVRRCVITGASKEKGSSQKHNMSSHCVMIMGDFRDIVKGTPDIDLGAFLNIVR